MDITWQRQLIDISIDAKANGGTTVLPFQIMRWTKSPRETSKTRPRVYRKPVASTTVDIVMEDAPAEFPKDDAQDIQKDDQGKTEQTDDGTFPVVHEHENPTEEQENAEADTAGLSIEQTIDPVIAAKEVAQGLAGTQADEAVGAGAAGSDHIKPEDYHDAVNKVEKGSEGMDVDTGAPESVPGQYSM